MPSPFPGMDPYLERYWGDIHQRFITYTCDALQGSLPAGLFARVQERVSVESFLEPSGSIYPDVRVVEKSREQPATALAGALATSPNSGGIAAVEPFRIKLKEERFVQSYIEIYERAIEGKVITVVEIISPSNKLPGKGRVEFRRKQKQCRRAGVNLVEIDLLRKGKWILSIPREQLPEDVIGLYGIGVVRASVDEFTGYYYPASLDRPLPPIGIPLRPKDSDAMLALQPLLDHCYDIGRYRELIDYEAELSPPLEGDVAQWAEAHLVNLGLRKSKAMKKKTAANGKQSKRPKKKRP